MGLVGATRQQLRIDAQRHVRNLFPRVTLVCIRPNIASSLIEVAINVARKIFLRRSREVRSTSRTASESRFPGNDTLPERTDVRYDRGQPKAVSKKQNAALKNSRVRQHKDICGFEKYFHSLVGNEFDSLNDLVAESRDGGLKCVPVILAILDCSANQQPIAGIFSHELFKRLQQILQAFVRSDSSEEKQRLVTTFQPKRFFGGRRSQSGIRESVIDSERNDGGFFR